MANLVDLRVDHIGSLVRPTELRMAFERHAQDALTDDDLRAVQDDAIQDVVREQENLGLPIVTDGEFRRRRFTDSFAEVAGFQKATMRERLRLTANRPLDEYRYAQALTERPVKATLLSADRVWQLCPADRSGIYPDDDAFLADVVAVQRQIIAELLTAGCSYIQVDGPGYAAYTDLTWIARLRGRGLDPIALLLRSAAADRAAIDGMAGTFGIHLCRGVREQGQWGIGGFDGIAEALFNSLPHDRFLLECDVERPVFSALRFVPKGKVVVLGLISTTEPTLEREEDVLRRIDEAAAYIDVDRLALSPQCGFAHNLEDARCTPSEQWRKLELVRRVADRVWPTVAA